MLKKYYYILLLTLLLPSGYTYALQCRSVAGEVAINVNIPELRIPTKAPIGTRVWESEIYTVNVNCWNNEFPEVKQENVYFYTAPEGTMPANTGLSSGIEILSPINQTSTVMSLINTGKTVTYSPTIKYTSFQISFRLFLILNQNLTNPPQRFPISRFKVFQLDGQGGLNSFNPSLSYTFVGLDRIKYLTCSANFAITPSNIGFGAISNKLNDTELATRSKEFNVSTLLTEQCAQQYSVGIKFDPDRYTKISGNKKEIQMDNGLSLMLDYRNNITGVSNQPVYFSQQHLLTTVNAGESGTKTQTYTAKLKRTSTTIPVKNGPFTEILRYQINYY